MLRAFSTAKNSVSKQSTGKNVLLASVLGGFVGGIYYISLSKMSQTDELEQVHFFLTTHSLTHLFTYSLPHQVIRQEESKK